MHPEFVPFPKIARLSREIVITEKIDGTNACVHIYKNPEGILAIMAGSRNGWITPEKDNHGFAKWVNAHREELIVGLGEGTHFGEWWGPGIQRGYGLKEKKFSLFNTHRWGDPAQRPKCCDVVPTLYMGKFDTNIIENVLDHLEQAGSQCSPGFMRPEGIVVYHKASNTLFKKTIEKDEEPKHGTHSQ